MFDTLVLNTQFGSGLVLLCFSLIQLTYRNKSFLNYNLAGTYIALAFMIIQIWFFSTGYIIHVTYLIAADIAMAFCIGPFIFYYLRAVTGLSDPGRNIYLTQFIPAILSLAIVTAVTATDTTIAAYYLTHSSNYPVPGINPVLKLLDTLSGLHMTAYGILSVWTILPVVRNRTHKSIREVKIILLYLILTVSAIAAVSIANFFNSANYAVLATNILCVLGIWYFIFSFRYPEFTQKAVKESRLVRYESDPVNEHDSAEILKRLETLMTDAKVFTDEELSLSTISTMLGVKAHQLSRIINEKKNMNFRAYLNAYRISEAKKLLIAELDTSILEIAFRTGFNSKSSFNDSFLKTTGMTPRDFKASGR